MATVYERVQKVVADNLKITDLERVTPQATLADDLHADSLDFVDLGMAIEEEFEAEGGKDFEIEDDDWEKVTGKERGYTVADIVAVLAYKGIKDKPN